MQKGHKTSGSTQQRTGTLSGMQPGCLALFGDLVALGSEGHPRVVRMEVNGDTNDLFTPLPAAHWGIAENVDTSVFNLLNILFSDRAYG